MATRVMQSDPYPQNVDLWFFTLTVLDRSAYWASLRGGNMPHNTAQMTQPGCHWVPQFGVSPWYTNWHPPTYQSVLCKSAPSCEPTKKKTFLCTSIPVLWSCQTRHLLEPVDGADDKEAFLCEKMEFILAHVHPAGCTSLNGIDAPILNNECGHSHELNAVSFSGDLQM